MRKNITTVTGVLLASVLLGCVAAPELIAKSADNSAGIDLGGRWVLRDESETPVSQVGSGEETIRIPRRVSQRRTGRPERSSGTAVHVFLETGKRLKITQTEDGLFISFDRAIVEEYTFGENRTVSVGPIEAQRVSGWEGRVFVVETMDDDGALLAESWQLDESGNELIRRISVVVEDEEKFATRQEFDRS